jgi:hypothetical protein
MTIATPVQSAAENPFEKVPLKKMTGVIKVSREAREAQILSVTLPRTKYQPGQTIKAFVTYRPFRGADAVMPMEFELPKNLPVGTYDFAVTDWQQHLSEEQMTRPFRFVAENSKQIFAVLKDYMSIRHDALYARLMLQPDGIAVGRTALPRFPSSRRQVLLSAGRSDVTSFVSSASRIVPTDYIMTGGAHFNITIEKENKIDSSIHPQPAHQPIPTTPPINNPALPATPANHETVEP